MCKRINLIRKKLDDLITKMSCNPESFVKNPGKDFTRSRKLDFSTVMRGILSMGGGSLSREMIRQTRFDMSHATVSAFVQQRDKLLPYAFKYLLSNFNKSVRIRRFHGYRVMAVDGSDLQITTDPSKTDSYAHNQYGGYNYIHVNAVFDICTGIYVDSLVQPANHSNEIAALTQMLAQPNSEEASIIVMDRNYESYNLLAYLNSIKQPFVLRIKDMESRGGIACGLKLNLAGEFDVQISRILTRKQNKVIRANPHIYHHLPSKVRFDFMDDETENCSISFRLTRFRIKENEYETIISNLSPDEFESEDIKRIYHMRWAIETSFRDLKYALGIVRLHSKRDECIEMEILAKMIMYNFSSMITCQVKVDRSAAKHEYKANFALAIHICMEFFRGNALSSKVEAVISSTTLPVRKGRSYPRKWHKSPVNFNYRIS
ncbi:MAG: IS4 family transposase [Eubacteriales bacterium]|nr:IS4 family transposase [Eubacteriales bacterium]